MENNNLPSRPNPSTTSLAEFQRVSLADWTTIFTHLYLCCFVLLSSQCPVAGQPNLQAGFAIHASSTFDTMYIKQTEHR